MEMIESFMSGIEGFNAMSGMVNITIWVGIFYLLHLFLTMGLSLHKVPFVNWTHAGGDISNMTEMSSRVMQASENLRQSLPIFFAFSILSVVLMVDNLLLARFWLVLRIIYLIGALANFYTNPYVRPLIWLPSIVILFLMGVSLYY